MSRHRLRPALRHNALHAVQGGFTGAYDDTDLFALYAMRLGLTSYYGSPLIRVRRSSDNAEDDIGHLSNGDLDTAAVADFLNGGSALIVTWYEQKNGNDATQATAAAQPLYVASGQNSRPVMRFDGSDDAFSISVADWGSTLSILAVVRHESSPGDQKLFDASSEGVFSNSTGVRLDFAGGDFRFGVDTDSTSGGAFNAVAGAAAWRTRTGYYDGAEMGQMVNGVSGTPTARTGDISYVDVPETYIGRLTDTASNHFAGDLAEMIVSSPCLSAAEREAAEAAAKDYLGVF